MAISTIGTNSLSDPIAVNGYTPTASNMQPFNRIINGAMTIDQRNAGASVTPTNATYALDRYIYGLTQASKFSAQQSTTAPAGFSNSMLITSLSAYSVLSTDLFQFEQRVEGFNFSDMAWGTASAATVTLSFQVRSSLTGTFGGSLRNNAGDRSYPFSYTINAANTWETKTITIAGDTTGTWVGGTNGIAVRVGFSIGAGSTYSGTAGAWTGANLLTATGATSVVGTSGATFYITGVQLEAGSAASPFAHENYGDTLQKCQRYYEIIGRDSGSNNYANIFSTPLDTFSNFWTRVSYLVEKRSSPALGFYSGVSWNSTVPTANLAGVNAVLFNATSWFFLEGGSGGNAPMAYVDAEL